MSADESEVGTGATLIVIRYRRSVGDVGWQAGLFVKGVTEPLLQVAINAPTNVELHEAIPPVRAEEIQRRMVALFEYCIGGSTESLHIEGTLKTDKGTVKESEPQGLFAPFTDNRKDEEN